MSSGARAEVARSLALTSILHVVVGMIAIVYLWWRTRRGAYGRHDCHALETGAAFWHMVDLLWIVLFPLVYVLR